MRCSVFCVLAISSFLGGCATYLARPLDAPALERAFAARRLDDPGLRTFVETATESASTVWPPSSVDLTTLTVIGEYYSADLDVARAHLTAADAAIRAAGARMNPSLSLDAAYDRNPESHREGGFGPSVTIETAGKRGDRILRAEHEAESAMAGFHEADWHLRSRVRAAFVNDVLARARLDLLQREIDVRNSLVDMIDRRVAVGDAARPELDIYRVELITAQAALRAATGDVVEARAALAATVGLPSAALVNTSLTAPAFDAPIAVDALPILSVERAGLLHRADVRRSLSDYAAADAGLRLELARQYPDLSLSPSYNFEEGFARYVLDVVIEPVAVFHHNQGPIAVAEALRDEAAARFEALQAAAVGEMEQAQAQYHAALDAWGEANDRLVAVQRDREDAARRALDIGDGDRLSLATAQLQTITAARTRLDALAHVHAALGALEDAMQQPLQSALMIPDPPRVSPRATRSLQ